MKFSNDMKTKAIALKKEVTALYYAYKNPRVSILPKIIILLTIGYALSPIDLIPDFIPIIGYLDDLIIIPLLISLSLKMIPGEIMQEARLKAENEPLRLKKNWFTGAIFILVWVILLFIIIRALIKLFVK